MARMILGAIMLVVVLGGIYGLVLLLRLVLRGIDRDQG